MRPSNGDSKPTLSFSCQCSCSASCYGAQKSLLKRENCTRIEQFATQAEVLNGNVGTANEYGKIKNELREKGRMIPENDLWIAALARQYDLTLVSDDRHFREIDGLRRESW